MSIDVGIRWLDIQKALRLWVAGGTGLPLDHVYWGGQDMPRVAEPAVELSVFADTQVGQPWLDREFLTLAFPSRVVSLVDPSTDTLTISNHGLVTGDGPLHLTTTGTLPVGLPFSVWVVVTGPSTLRVCDDFRKTGGNFSGNPVTTLDIQNAGTGTLSLSGTPRTQRAGHELDYVARANTRCTVALDCHTSAAVGLGMALSLLEGVAARRPLPSQQRILAAVNAGVEVVERARGIRGVRNAVMFEPRATMLVHLSVPSEAREAGTVIRYASGTNQITGLPFSAP